MQRSLIGSLALVAGTSLAATVQLPGGNLVVPGLSTTGTSFVYSGTLTQADTIAFTQTGNPCLQSAGTAYCTNGAGVLTVAGSSPVGAATTFAGPAGIIPAGTWTYGALLMQISGVGTVQIWPADAAHGLGSPTPPAGFTLPPTTLAALGFPTFSQVNPTITFVVADTIFADNGGQFTLAQPLSTPVPTLGAWSVTGLVLLLAVLGVAALRRRSA
jgi:hypothetical protein